MKTYTTAEIAEEKGCSLITVLRWARNNEVQYVGEGKRKVYVFSEDDRNRFIPKKVGRPKER
jgi:predicted site-specific integrase-resolvase